MPQLPRAVRAGIADDQRTVTHDVFRVGDEHDVLVPVEKVALARGAADDEALHAVGELVLQVRVVRVEVDLPIWVVRRLDGGHQAQLLQRLRAVRLDRVVDRREAWRNTAEWSVLAART